MDVGRHRVGLVERADAHEAHRVAGAGVVAPQRDAALGQRQIFWPLPLADGVITASGSPASSSTRSASIMALSAKAAPVSRWHQRQWQQCTNSGLDVMR